MRGIPWLISFPSPPSFPTPRSFGKDTPDPGVLARIGSIYQKMGDDAQSLAYYQDAHRVYPADMNVISWLGAYYVQSDLFEKAMPYFELAARLEPHEVKWHLMVASCLRRSGLFPQALERYHRIHKDHPDNAECLRYLVKLSRDMGQEKDAAEFDRKLKSVERTAAMTTVAMAAAGPPAGGFGGAGVGGMMRPMPAPAAAPADPSGGFGLLPDRADLSSLPQPKSSGVSVVLGQKKRDDEWGDDLGQDLLPGLDDL